ncbi:hypothetical protein BGZ49_002146 [Haplosporangium sp. Z 27]|nr:hypothetical protein BGZ49_002146 [Haplosporangium sp. Z 27]
MISAVDPEPFDYKGLPKSIESEPSSDVMRHLVGLYMLYSHPVHRIVDDSDPEFWTRLDHPMEPEVASLVYAMCTVGAILKSKAPSSGHLDDLVYYFYRRALALVDERPKDLVTIQTLVIIQHVNVVAHQTKKCSEVYLQMIEIADSINLGERVKKTSSLDVLSKEDELMRNTWRTIIWWETLTNMITLNNGNANDPLKDLSSHAIDSRPEEFPGASATALEALYYHYASLFKIFQTITKIKLPMSPRCLHPVTDVLDLFNKWHNNLPKSLLCTPRTGGETFSSHATSLDLYFRLGHMLLLNLLPPSVRSSPTGLGPRRESPLRILATCANGITAAMGDLIKEPDLRNYCMVHGMRCLTEAAMIQLFNSKEPDPAISTPAKVNLMKTLWCIKQFNFAVPAETLNSILALYDTAVRQTTSGQQRDRQSSDKGLRDTSRKRTPSIPVIKSESPTLSGFPRGGREFSLVSDYSSSPCSTREGSHVTACETNDMDRDRPNISPTSPTQDGAAASLLELSLESPTVVQRGFGFESHDVSNLASVYETARVKLQTIDSKSLPQSSREEMSLISPKIEQDSDHNQRIIPEEYYTKEYDAAEMPRSLQARESRMSSPDFTYQEPHQLRRTLKVGPTGSPSQLRHHTGRGYDSGPQDYFSLPGQKTRGDNAYRAGPRSPHLNTSTLNFPYNSHEGDSRVPLTVNSEIRPRDGHARYDVDQSHIHDYSHHHQQSVIQPQKGPAYGMKGYERKTVISADLGDVTSIAGRKRPSTSMYSPSTPPGAGRVIGDMTEVAAYYPDPLHQDGADAARSRELKYVSIDHQTRSEYKPQQHHNGPISSRHAETRHPHVVTRTMEGLYPPQPVLSSPTESPLSTRNHLLDSPLNHNRHQHSSQMHPPQNHSYYQPYSSPPHYQQRSSYQIQKGQHEPRTSPGSIASPSLSSHPYDYLPSNTHSISRSSDPYSPQNQQDLYGHSERLHYLRQNDPSFLIQSRQLPGRSQGMSPPPLPSSLEWTGDYNAGTRPSSKIVHSEEDDPVSEIADLLRDPIRRKYQ